MWIVAVDPGYYPYIEEHSSEEAAKEAYDAQVEANKDSRLVKIWWAKVQDSATF